MVEGSVSRMCSFMFQHVRVTGSCVDDSDPGDPYLTVNDAGAYTLLTVRKKTQHTS